MKLNACHKILCFEKSQGTSLTRMRLKVFFIGKLIEIQNRDFLLSLENVKREDAGD